MSKASRDLSRVKCMAENSLVTVLPYLLSPPTWHPSCVPSREDKLQGWHLLCLQLSENRAAPLLVKEIHVSASSSFLLSLPPLTLGVQCCWKKRVGDLALKKMNPRTEQESSGSSYFYQVTENKFVLFVDGTSRQDKMLKALKFTCCQPTA